MIWSLAKNCTSRKTVLGQPIVTIFFGGHVIFSKILRDCPQLYYFEKCTTLNTLFPTLLMPSNNKQSTNKQKRTKRMFLNSYTARSTKKIKQCFQFPILKQSKQCFSKCLVKFSKKKYVDCFVFCIRIIRCTCVNSLEA